MCTYIVIVNASKNQLVGSKHVCGVSPPCWWKSQLYICMHSYILYIYIYIYIYICISIYIYKYIDLYQVELWLLGLSLLVAPPNLHLKNVVRARGVVVHFGRSRRARALGRRQKRPHLMQRSTISFLQCRWARFPDRGSLALFAIFDIWLPATVEFSWSSQG